MTSNEFAEPGTPSGRRAAISKRSASAVATRRGSSSKRKVIAAVIGLLVVGGSALLAIWIKCRSSAALTAQEVERTNEKKSDPALKAAAPAQVHAESAKKRAHSLSKLALSSKTLSGGGFEVPAIGATYQYTPAGSPWTFAAQSGISGNGTGFTGSNPNAPEGTQIAFIQGNGTITQVVNLVTGTYVLTFQAAQRASCQNSFQIVNVLVDKQNVGDFRPGGTNYETETTHPFAVAAGDHTICFTGLNPNGGDNTAFIDNIQLQDLGSDGIVLGEPEEMNRIRFQVSETEKQIGQCMLHLTSDGKTWTALPVKSGKSDSGKWTEVKFDRQKVGGFAIDAFGDGMADALHVAEIHAFNDNTEIFKSTRRAPPRGPCKTAPENLKPGIVGEYFDGMNSFVLLEDAPDLIRAQNGLFFNPAPAPGGPATNWPFAGPCAAVYSGYLKVEHNNLYTFFLETENCAHVYLDGDLLLDTGSAHKHQELWEQADLVQGLHRLWVEYYTGAPGVTPGLNLSLKPKGESGDGALEKMLCYDSSDVASVNVKARVPSSVKFISRDDKRGGSWRKDVGHDGYVIFNKATAGQHLVKLPPYIRALSSEASHYVWQLGDDPRELEDPEGKGPRVAECEYSGDDERIEITAARDIVCRCALYCLDFDRLGRTQHMQFFDGDKLLYEQDVSNMGDGAWLHYEICGSVTIKLTNTGPANAVVAGVFWDCDKGLNFRTPPKSVPASGDVKPGLRAEYFDGLTIYPTEDDKATFKRIEPALSFAVARPNGNALKDWPFSGDSAALFQGCLKIEQDDKYTFVLEAGDAAQLYLDGTLVAERKRSDAAKEVEGSVDLKSGLHRIWVACVSSGGNVNLNVSLKQKDGKKAAIPAAMLCHE